MGLFLIKWVRTLIPEGEGFTDALPGKVGLTIQQAPGISGTEELGSFEQIVHLHQQTKIAFDSVTLLHESHLPIHFTSADCQPNF